MAAVPGFRTRSSLEPDYAIWWSQIAQSLTYLDRIHVWWIRDFNKFLLWGHVHPHRNDIRGSKRRATMRIIGPHWRARRSTIGQQSSSRIEYHQCLPIFFLYFFHQNTAWFFILFILSEHKARTAFARSTCFVCSMLLRATIYHYIYTFESFYSILCVC